MKKFHYSGKQTGSHSSCLPLKKVAEKYDNVPIDLSEVCCYI